MSRDFRKKGVFRRFAPAGWVFDSETAGFKGKRTKDFRCDGGGTKGFAFPNQLDGSPDPSAEEDFNPFQRNKKVTNAARLWIYCPARTAPRRDQLWPQVPPGEVLWPYSINHSSSVHPDLIVHPTVLARTLSVKRNMECVQRALHRIAPKCTEKCFRFLAHILGFRSACRPIHTNKNRPGRTMEFRPGF